MFYGYGWSVIFPIIGLIFMLLMMSRMFGFWRRGLRRGTGMGSMCMMGGDHGHHSERDESAVEMLRRRYAAGELTDEQFDAMRRRLEDQA